LCYEFEIDILWQDGKLVEAKIYSSKTQQYVIRYESKRVEIKAELGNRYILNNDLQILNSIE